MSSYEINVLYIAMPGGRSGHIKAVLDFEGVTAEDAVAELAEIERRLDAEGFGTTSPAPETTSLPDEDVGYPDPPAPVSVRVARQQAAAGRSAQGGVECGLCGEPNCYDNRAENQKKKAENPTATTGPDFRCRKCKAGTWLTKTGDLGKWVPARS